MNDKDLLLNEKMCEFVIFDIAPDLFKFFYF
jgi:hypothetical protein